MEASSGSKSVYANLCLILKSLKKISAASRSYQVLLDAQTRKGKTECSPFLSLATIWSGSRPDERLDSVLSVRLAAFDTHLGACRGRLPFGQRHFSPCFVSRCERMRQKLIDSFYKNNLEIAQRLIGYVL